MCAPPHPRSHMQVHVRCQRLLVNKYCFCFADGFAWWFWHTGLVLTTYQRVLARSQSHTDSEVHLWRAAGHWRTVPRVSETERREGERMRWAGIVGNDHVLPAHWNDALRLALMHTSSRCCKKRLKAMFVIYAKCGIVTSDGDWNGAITVCTVHTRWLIARWCIYVYTYFIYI